MNALKIIDIKLNCIYDQTKKKLEKSSFLLKCERKNLSLSFCDTINRFLSIFTRHSTILMPTTMRRLSGGNEVKQEKDLNKDSELRQMPNERCDIKFFSPLSFSSRHVYLSCCILSHKLTYHFRSKMLV